MWGYMSCKFNQLVPFLLFISIKMDWKKYEYINKHIELYSHKTWHWSSIPEMELFNSGYIINHNDHRMKRLQPTDNSYTEYGLDGLSAR